MRFKLRKPTVVVEDLTLSEALVYFDGKVSGVWPYLTQEQLNDVLEGYRSAMGSNPKFADEIKRYLTSHGVSIADIRPTRYELFDSGRLMRRIQRPDAKVRPWLWDLGVKIIRIIRRIK